jgi:hypothetical protein
LTEQLTEKERKEIEEEEKIRLESKEAQAKLVYNQRLAMIEEYIFKEREKWRNKM